VFFIITNNLANPFADKRQTNFNISLLSNCFYDKSIKFCAKKRQLQEITVIKGIFILYQSGNVLRQPLPGFIYI